MADQSKSSEQPKTDAMRAAESKGMQTAPQGGKNPPSMVPGGFRREADQPPTQQDEDRQQQEATSTVPGSAVGHDANTGSDRVTASRSQDVAAAQGLAFNTGTLYDLQNIYSNLRDGNYFQALKMSVGFLDSILNPDSGSIASTTSGRNVVRAGAMRPPRSAMPMPHDEQGQKVYDDVCNKLEKWAQSAHRQPEMALSSAERNAPARIGAGELATIIQLILQLVGQFRSGQ